MYGISFQRDKRQLMGGQFDFVWYAIWFAEYLLIFFLDIKVAS